MGLTYFKRYRMEVNLRRRLQPLFLPPSYGLIPWSAERICDHAEVKYLSFRSEIDSCVFSCLGELEGCRSLMEEISRKPGFMPEATWLIEHTGRAGATECCGTIQGVRATPRYGGIQNIGVVPRHRGHGVGRALLLAALAGFQHVGLPKAYLEVTASNTVALRMYHSLGFRRVKTLYKPAELAFS